MHPRQVAFSTVRCVLMLPIGLRLFRNESTHKYETLTVSTVCLDGGHLEATVPGSVDAETGYETMVFLKETSFFHLYQQHYKTKAEAARGHRQVIKKLLARKLPLAINVTNYTAYEELPPAEPSDANLARDFVAAYDAGH